MAKKKRRRQPAKKEVKPPRRAWRSSVSSRTINARLDLPGVSALRSRLPKARTAMERDTIVGALTQCLRFSPGPRAWTAVANHFFGQGEMEPCTWNT